MSLYGSYKTDATVENEGAWFPYGDGVCIRLARAGGANKNFLRCAEVFSNKYRAQLNRKQLPNDVALDAIIELYADAVVIAWEGVTDENGDDLVCTKSNVIKVLTDLPDLFAQVQEDATEREAFKEFIKEADSKNLSSVSSTD